MPKNAETVSRRPKIVIVWHNQCQAEPMSFPCRYFRHQSAVPETFTLMTGESTGERHWLNTHVPNPAVFDFSQKSQIMRFIYPKLEISRVFASFAPTLFNLCVIDHLGNGCMRPARGA